MVQRYDDVLVHEPGIAAWRGNVRAIKPPVSMSKKGKKVDQWAEIRRESDGLEWAIPLVYLEVLEEDVEEGRTGAPDDSEFKPPPW